MRKATPALQGTTTSVPLLRASASLPPYEETHFLGKQQLKQEEKGRKAQQEGRGQAAATTAVGVSLQGPARAGGGTTGTGACPQPDCCRRALGAAGLSSPAPPPGSSLRFHPSTTPAVSLSDTIVTGRHRWLSFPLPCPSGLPPEEKLWRQAPANPPRPSHFFLSVSGGSSFAVFPRTNSTSRLLCPSPRPQSFLQDEGIHHVERRRGSAAANGGEHTRQSGCRDTTAHGHQLLLRESREKPWGLTELCREPGGSQGFRTRSREPSSTCSTPEVCSGCDRAPQDLASVLQILATALLLPQCLATPQLVPGHQGEPRAAAKGPGAARLRTARGGFQARRMGPESSQGSTARCPEAGCPCAPGTQRARRLLCAGGTVGDPERPAAMCSTTFPTARGFIQPAGAGCEEHRAHPCGTETGALRAPAALPLPPGAACSARLRERRGLEADVSQKPSVQTQGKTTGTVPVKNGAAP